MKSNFKLTLSLISLGILIYSGFGEAFIVNDYSIDIFNVKGFGIILLGSFIYLYVIKTGKKLLCIISYIVTAIVYIYSIHLIISTANSVELSSNINDSGIYFSKIGTGTYSYITSGILHLISILLPNKKQTKNSESNTEIINSLGIEQNNNISKDDYILCKYIYGCKNLNSYSNGALKINRGNSISIIVVSEENKIQESKINYNEIKNIDVKSNVIITESKPETNDNTLANTALATAIIGGPIVPIAANYLSNQINEYSKIKTNMIYDIIIEINNGTIMIQTKTNPQEIVNKIKSNL